MIIIKFVVLILCFWVMIYFVNNLDKDTDTGLTKMAGLSVSPMQLVVSILGIALSASTAIAIAWTMRKR